MTVSPDNQNSQVSRRSLARRAGTVAAAWAVTGRSAPPPKESLALDGGPKVVRYSPEQQRAISKWPRYGDLDKEAVLELLGTNKFYEEIP